MVLSSGGKTSLSVISGAESSHSRIILCHHYLIYFIPTFDEAAMLGTQEKKVVTSQKKAATADLLQSKVVLR